MAFAPKMISVIIRKKKSHQKKFKICGTNESSAGALKAGYPGKRPRRDKNGLRPNQKERIKARRKAQEKKKNRNLREETADRGKKVGGGKGKGPRFSKPTRLQAKQLEAMQDVKGEKKSKIARGKNKRNRHGTERKISWGGS